MSKWWWPWWFVVLWFGIPGEFPLKAMQFFWASQRIPNHWDPKAPSPRSDAWSPCGSNISGMISATRPRKSIQRRTELCGWSLLVKIYRKDVKCRQHIPTIFNPDVGFFLQKRRSLTWDFKVLFVNQVIPLIQVFLRSKHCNCTLPRKICFYRDEHLNSFLLRSWCITTCTFICFAGFRLEWWIDMPTSRIFHIFHSFLFAPQRSIWTLWSNCKKYTIPLDLFLLDYKETI